MKKLFISLFLTAYMLSIPSAALAANDMKSYHNTNDHYSILIPKEAIYQDAEKLDTSNLYTLSMAAITKSDTLVYIQKLQKARFSPIENWSQTSRENFSQGIVEKEASQNAVYVASGDATIHDTQFLWFKFKTATQEELLYAFVHETSLYCIGYLYPIDQSDNIAPTITASISSLQFDGTEKNWYWIDSDRTNNVYIDINNISSFKEPAATSRCKQVAIKFTAAENDDPAPYDVLIADFKAENGHHYFRPVSFLNFGSDQNLLARPSNLGSINRDKKSIDLSWKELEPNDPFFKITALLFSE